MATEKVPKLVSCVRPRSERMLWWRKIKQRLKFSFVFLNSDEQNATLQRTNNPCTPLYPPKISLYKMIPALRIWCQNFYRWNFFFFSSPFCSNVSYNPRGNLFLVFLGRERVKHSTAFKKNPHPLYGTNGQENFKHKF